MTQATKPLLLQPTTRHAVAATTLIIPIIPTGAATQRSTNQTKESAARTVLHACTIAILRDCTRLSRRRANAPAVVTQLHKPRVRGCRPHRQNHLVGIAVREEDRRARWQTRVGACGAASSCMWCASNQSRATQYDRYSINVRQSRQWQTLCHAHRGPDQSRCTV